MGEQKDGWETTRLPGTLKPAKMRDKLDLAYRIKGQSVVIFSIRPFRKDDSEKIEGSTAKATEGKILETVSDKSDNTD